MNKTLLARQIDHALKAAEFQKSVIKGIGWKGRGSRYRRTGFVIDTKTNAKGIIVRYCDWDNAGFMSKHQDGLTDKGHAQLMQSKQRMRESISRYKTALTTFNVESKDDENGLPILEIT